MRGPQNGVVLPFARQVDGTNPAQQGTAREIMLNTVPVLCWNRGEKTILSRQKSPLSGDARKTFRLASEPILMASVMCGCL